MPRLVAEAGKFSEKPNSNPEMIQSGYAAVGHLLALDGPNQPQVEQKGIAKHFLTVLLGNVEDSMVLKTSGFWQFESFFNNVDVTVETFGKFLDGVLKRLEVDSLSLQLIVEKLVWNMVKFHLCQLPADQDQQQQPPPDRASSNDFDVDEVVNHDFDELFMLFGLFNRLCASCCLPMRLNDNALAFLFSKMGIQVPKKVPGSNAPHGGIESVLQEVIKHPKRSTTVAFAIKKLYDRLVRDVLMEGQVVARCAPKNVLGGTGGVAAQQTRRTVHLTTKHMRILNCGDKNGVETPPSRKLAPKRGSKSEGVLCELLMAGAESKVFTKQAMFTGKQNTVILVKNPGYCGHPGIEMVFDPLKDSFDIFTWNRAIIEAINFSKTGYISCLEMTLAENRVRIGDCPNFKNHHSFRSLSSDVAAGSTHSERSPSGNLCLPKSLLITAHSSKSASYSDSHVPAVELTECEENADLVDPVGGKTDLKPKQEIEAERSPQNNSHSLQNVTRSASHGEGQSATASSAPVKPPRHLKSSTFEEGE